MRNADKYEFFIENLFAHSIVTATIIYNKKKNDSKSNKCVQVVLLLFFQYSCSIYRFFYNIYI